MAVIQYFLLELSAKEREWLDQLEAKLEKSTNSVADAEEISEALDVSQPVTPNQSFYFV